MNERWAEESWAIILPTRACGGPNLGTTWVGGVPDAESFVEFFDLWDIHCSKFTSIKIYAQIPLF
jgi:hypothetical protein